MRLLIAEDDRALAGFLARGLRSVNDEVELAYDGDSAIASFLRNTPDLVLLDLEMPGCTGMEVLAAIRARSPLIPVLVLSGRAGTETRIACLDLGADDCMMKPFALGELRARCGALRRRSLALQQMQPTVQAVVAELRGETLVFGTLTLLRLRRTAEIAGAPLHLTHREFALLEQLVLAAGKPVSRAALRAQVWKEKPLETNAIDVHIGALRKKLSQRPGAPNIETARGAGFLLTLPSVTAQVVSFRLPPPCPQTVPGAGIGEAR